MTWKIIRIIMVVTVNCVCLLLYQQVRQNSETTESVDSATITAYATPAELESLPVPSQPSYTRTATVALR